MKRIALGTLLIVVVFLSSCSSSRKFQASTAEDKPLFAAINELNKRPNNNKAQADLKTFYSNSIRHHEDMLDAYSQAKDLNRWDKMLSELNALQNIYTSLQATPASFSIVKPKNYQREIDQLKQQAAADFYERGTDLLSRSGRENALEAYKSFRQADRFVKGYKDTDKLIRESFENSVINVVINPIQDNNIMFSRFDSWGADFRYRPEDYQQSLARELTSRTANDLPARFFTDREVDRKRINPDIEVNLAWRNLDGFRNNPYRYTRQVSRNIHVGSDTSGHPVYRKVYATLQITRNVYQVRGDMEYQVADLHSNNTIDYGNVSDQVEWDDSYATYSGDSRALSQEDWMLINNSAGRQSPTRGDIMNALMRKIYPDLRRRIEMAID